jgi:hypothetical protein
VANAQIGKRPEQKSGKRCSDALELRRSFPIIARSFSLKILHHPQSAPAWCGMMVRPFWNSSRGATVDPTPCTMLYPIPL